MINWIVSSLNSNPSTGIVISAVWSCSDEQVKRSGESYFPEPSENIIPYTSLTEQDVLNWIWTDGGVDKTLVEESITKELNDLINPVVVKNPLPWI